MFEFWSKRKETRTLAAGLRAQGVAAGARVGSFAPESVAPELRRALRACGAVVEEVSARSLYAIAENAEQVQRILSEYPGVRLTIVLDPVAMRVGARFPKAIPSLITLNALGEIGRRIHH